MAPRRRKKMKSLSEAIQVVPPHEGGTRPELPTELLEAILSQLSLRDNIRASAVCWRWRRVANSVRRANKPPWLMFFPKFGDMYEFYDPSQRKTYWLELPELQGSRICYANDGWLLLYKPRTHNVFFYCPYTREVIDLPCLELTYQRVAFSAAPTSPGCTLFTVTHVSPTIVAVSTCHPGDTEWATVNYQNRLPFVSSIWNKLVYCKGLFYCLSLTGWLGVYNPDKGTWAVDSVPPPKCPENFFVKNWWKGKFMTEHNGDIFVIYTCSAVNPVVYKLDQTSKVWVEMESLCGMTLFANLLTSHARTDLLGMMRNNVYFSKVRFYGKRCVLYSLDNGRYYPRKQLYDWGEQDPFESVWIEAPDDLSVFL
ncbi:F-box/kelch-repeat protein At1g57790-like [Andrographis paniculata]|uniref:F-box/kelch-repeat protein At1g57790-like n=1 Tax=Andrographis paniculata TaxID=175694 RepID=UPI0021E84024|nr:F-box/kelch-repeat protein At1g57790-like [Andrographis paniculata]XP_051150616.1 F-box/kelch-repeat protein At1g57790-like [Andrographis paniculata]XP_051150618.1 F-box/kelch-repeat protein At1g57790-like [Andrographis paniculata]